MNTTTLQYTERQMRCNIYLATTVVSIMLSLWLIHTNEIVNHDAIYYFNAIFGEEESLRRLNNWLFYPKLIYWLSSATGMGIQTSAYTLNTLLDTLLVLAFLHAAEELGAESPVLIWAALIILSLPYLNDNRTEIIRGHGYWAFTLLAFFHYIRLYRQFSWPQLFAWIFLMALATLFRIEGLVLVLLLPLGLLLNSQLSLRKQMLNISKCYLPLFAILLLLTSSYFLLDSFQNRLLEVIGAFTRLIESITSMVPAKATLLRQHVLPMFSTSNALIGIYATAAAIIILDFIQAMSVVYFAVWVARKYFPPVGLARDAPAILLAWSVANAAILIPYMLYHFVMVSRYTLLIAILLLIVVAFALAEIRRKAIEESSRKHRMLYVIVTLLVAVLFLDSIIESSSSKTYIKEAGRWMMSNIDNCTIIATDHQRDRLRYYANNNQHGFGCLKVVDLGTAKGRRHSPEWLALEVDDRKLLRPAFLKHRETIEKKAFLNTKGDGYFLYQIIDDHGG